MALANIGAFELYFIILVDHITEVRYQEVLLIVQTDGNDVRRLQEIAKEHNPELHSCGNENPFVLFLLFFVSTQRLLVCNAMQCDITRKLVMEIHPRFSQNFFLIQQFTTQGSGRL